MSASESPTSHSETNTATAPTIVASTAMAAAELNQPRKLARRKSKRLSFSMSNNASTTDLKKVFMLYGSRSSKGAGSTIGTEAGSNMDQEGTINAMQFSTIWRLITEEKGNLFKEMQMFKKFDSGNNGYLSRADFITGWVQMASEVDGDGDKGDHYLKRIKSLADNCEVDSDDDSD